MKSLLIIAHGSRAEGPKIEIAELVDLVSAHNYDRKGFAFLELATPSIQEKIAEEASKGTKSITIVPYFLNNGKHVSRDLPKIISDMREKYPDMEFTTTSYFGENKALLSSLITKLI